MIARFTWRVGEAQWPLFVCGYQWLQVVAAQLQAELHHGTVSDLYGGDHFETAAWFSLAGVTLFSITFGTVLQSRLPQTLASIAALPIFYLRLNHKPLFITWLVLFFLDTTLGPLSKSLGIASLWGPISYLRFGFAMLVFQTVVMKRYGWGFLIAVVVLESLAGFLSFFSSFKTIFFVLLLSIATILHFRKSSWIPFLVGSAFVLILGFFWQVIKVDYRQFVNGGSREQVVVVSRGDQIEYLKKSASGFEVGQFKAGAESIIARLEYIKFFGHCLVQVPATVPHSRGRLWGEAVASVFMPRIFFPKKMAFNDSDRTNEFSGIRVADANEGTSIGIGYVGESYIDFGFFGMFIPIGLVGLLTGWFYSILIRVDAGRLFGMASSAALLLASQMLLETSNAKMVGSLVSSFLVLRVCLAVQKYFFPALPLIFFAPKENSPKAVPLCLPT